jgi:hypothetical protein
MIPWTGQILAILKWRTSSLESEGKQQAEEQREEEKEDIVNEIH